MNIFSIFNFFCCGGCRPSRVITQCAFFPPTPPTYKMIQYEQQPSKCVLKIHNKRHAIISRNVFYATNSRGNQIACIMIPYKGAMFTIIYSHGNGCDMGQSLHYFVQMSTYLRCNVLLYDYSGYGSSTGSPSEENLYRDIEAVFTTLKSKYKVDNEQIILYGQSIGSVPTVYLASKFQVAGVVLHCALLSALRVLFPNIKKSLCFDGLRTIDKLCKIQSPVLVIHGTSDEVVDFTHGVTIYEACPNTVDPLWLSGAGHNNIELFEQYLPRLNKFINEELMHKKHNII